MAILFFAPLSTHAQMENNPDIPKIILRSEWGADEFKMTWPTKYAKVEKIVIHHTASSNLVPDPDGSGEYKNMVNSIYTYHNGKKIWYDDGGEEYVGFGDIGYNYLIDPNGNIYEGRTGGNGVVAGHVNGYNIGSVGIAVLGRYQDYVDSENNTISSHLVTSAVKKSLESLIGWLAANNDIDLNKISDFHGKNIDGVVGHRDLTPTICPGDELYKILSEVQKNADEKEKAYKNYVYQIAGETFIYVIADGYKMKFDSKEVLPNAYKNKMILPISKSQLDAYKYKNSIVYPDGSLLQKFDTPEVYYIENGKKRHLAMTGEEFVKMGFLASEIKKVLPSDLKIYENGKIIKYAPDSQLIKDRSGNVFLAESGKKRKFTSPQLFEYLNYKWKNIKEDGYLSFYLDGPDMIYPNGVLVRQAGKNETYLIENKQRREISSDKLMNVLKYNPANTISITENELNHFPAGEKMKYPDNTLVKIENSPAVYLIKNGKRKEFASAVIFEKLGYKWNNIIIITKSEIENHPADGKVLYPDGFLIKSLDNPAIYILEGGKKRKITSAVLFEKRGYKWNDVIFLNPKEIKDYPDGEIMTYPDGTLIKREGFPTIYKIENGYKKEFISLALFEATKSRWSDVIVLSKEEFLAYPNGGTVKYPDGALIKEKGADKVYAIKNGMAEWIKTAEEFKKANYRWSEIVEISKAEMNLYIAAENATAGANPISQTPRQNDVKKTNAPDNPSSNNTNSYSANDADNTARNNASENNPNIRIAIYSSSGEDVKIAANGNYTVNYYNSNGTINKTENKSPNEQMIVPYFSSSSYVKFIPVSRDVILKIISYEDLSWNKAVNDNEFRGNIEIKYSDTSKKLWVINELSLEDYNNGIAEALNDSPEEYLKAFGTITRTYAMYYIKKGGKHSGEPFHLKNSRNGNGNDQVYKGYDFELRAPKIVSTNKSTVGQIITYKNEPIVAAYSSDSGGTTKDGCKILGYCGDGYVYLKGGINDPLNTKHDQATISKSHGAGMSAVGAYQMALNGKLWEEVIKHYYPEVEIERHY